MIFFYFIQNNINLKFLFKFADVKENHNLKIIFNIIKIKKKLFIYSLYDFFILSVINKFNIKTFKQEKKI